MKLQSVLYLSLLAAPAYLYNAHRPNSSSDVCPKARNDAMNCDCQCCARRLVHISEVPHLEARIFDQHPKEYAYPDEDENFKLPSYFDEEKEEDHSSKLARQKNINVAFLTPISSIDDLIELNSEELISAQKSAPKKWIEHASNIRTPPEFLPDVVLSSKDDNQVRKAMEAEALPQGRRYVMDQPVPVTDMVQMERSELTQETKDMESELGEGIPEYKIPEVRFETVAQRPPAQKRRNYVQMEPLEQFAGDSEAVEDFSTPVPPVLVATSTTKAPNGVKKRRKSKRKARSKPETSDVEIEG